MVKKGDRRAFYRDLMRRFVAFEIDGAAFKDQLIARFSEETRAEVARTNAIDAPFRLELQRRLARREISQDEFARAWRERFGITEEEWALDDVLSHVFTECDAFVHDPSLEVDYENPLTEEQLRAYVAETLATSAALREAEERST